jgi:signal peptidase I
MEEPISNPAPGQPAAPAKNDFGKKSLSFAWEVIKIILVAAVIVLPIRYFVFQPFVVKGDSMIPNLQSGDYLIVDEISYRLSPPQRGDIVVLKYPLDTTQRFIKRVIGLPGETVEIKNGQVNIIRNGQDITLNEKKYLPDVSGTAGTVNVTLGPDSYFVMGDNRQFSYDSRSWGLLSKSDIIGRALFRIYPFTKLSYISDPVY